MRTKVYHVLPREMPKLDVTALLEEAEVEMGRADGERKEAWVL